MIRATMALIFAAATFVGCGSSSGGSGGGSPSTDTATGTGTGTGAGTGTTTTAWTDTAMQSLVTSRCATSGCHDGTQSPKYKGISESAMKSDNQAMSEVNRGRMPRNGSLTSAELATFQGFYNK